MPADELKPTKKPKLITNSIGMKLALVPPGAFTMGTAKDEKGRHASEGPAHRVRITKPFWMGIYEVTQEEYMRVMASSPSRFKAVADQNTKRFPVESVTWDETVDFCKKLSAVEAETAAERAYRLPTEAEWEYACRAGTTTVFSFGDVLSSDTANVNGNVPYGDAPRGKYLQRPTVVGSYSPNAFGLYDMHGNVYEWCADWFAKDAYSTLPEKDPTGPENGQYRVIRGGSWRTIPSLCRSGERYYDLGDLKPATQAVRRYPDYGFRVCCSVPAS